MKTKFFVIVRDLGTPNQAYWHTERNGNGGNWTANLAQAKIYKSERAAHVSWVGVNRRFPNVHFEAQPVDLVEDWAA